MKRILKISALGAFTALAVTLAALSAGALKKTASASERPAAAIAAVSEEPQAKYILRNRGGFVAVYEVTGADPIIETEIEVEFLREYDRRALEAGMEARDYSELQQLLEDLSN
ncbi:MAG: hypothetical protein LBC78_02430 [Oscillospiraceae bacterium]|jgi:hypothetical protein|nr:hypothetical protein [Oscillospiraceae bacterium]